MITNATSKLLYAAAELISTYDSTGNAEYDRAIVELVSKYLDLPEGSGEAVKAILRALA